MRGIAQLSPSMGLGPYIISIRPRGWAPLQHAAPRAEGGIGQRGIAPRAESGIGQFGWGYPAASVHPAGLTAAVEGLGTAADFDAADKQLVALVSAAITVGDTLFAANDFTHAVAAYQDAGQQGVEQVGPAIDKAGAPNVTQPLTQSAFKLNGPLHDKTVVGDPNTVVTQLQAFGAQQIAKNMQGLYAQAIVAGRVALGQQPPPPPPQPPQPPQPPPAAETSYTVPILVAAGAISLGVIGWAVYTRRGARGASAREDAGEARLTYQQKKRLRRTSFALPERRALPLTDAAHVRNAAARLAQMRKRGTVTPEEYRRAKRAIIRRACKFGVQRTCAATLGE
jgi:hypothetical protein